MIIHFKNISLVNAIIFLTLTAQSQSSSFVSLHQYIDPAVNNVSSVSKDNENFLWISTQDAVFRFDGKQFKDFPVGKSIDSLFNSVAPKRVFVNATNNQIFATISNIGLSILNRHGTQSFFQTIELVGASDAEQVLNVLFLGQINIVTTISGVYSYEFEWNNTRRRYVAKLLDAKPLLTTAAITKTGDSSFAMLTTDKSVIFELVNSSGKIQTSKILSLLLLQQSVDHFFVLANHGGTFYLGTNEGLFIFRDHDSQLEFVGHLLPTQEVYSIVFGANRESYVAASEGLYKLRDLHIAKVDNNSTSQDENSLSSVFNMYTSKDGVWLAAQTGLSLLNDNSAFYRILNTYADNRKLAHVYNLGINGDSDVMISGEEGLFKSGSDRRVQTVQQSNTFFLSFTDPFGKFIVSDLHKTYLCLKNSLTPIEKEYPEFSAFNTLSFNDYEYLGDTALLLSTENEKGVFEWNYKRRKVSKIESLLGLPEIFTQTNGMYQDGFKTFVLTDLYWFVCDKQGIEKHQLFDSARNTSYGLIFDLVRVGKYYYFACYNTGIVKTDLDFKILKVFDKNAGLSSNGVYRMVNVGDTSLFFSTNNGIDILHFSDQTIRVLNDEDGLHGNVFEELSSARKGNILYFGGKGGVSEIDLTRLTFEPTINNLRFLDCKSVDSKNRTIETDLLGTKKIAIASDVSQVSIGFQNVVFPFSNKTSYEYRIPEIQNNWISNGNKNFITLIDQKPGVYHLQVRVSNQDNTWSVPTELVLEYFPKWYQTWWFKAIILVAALGILYSFYQFRINQIKKQHQIRKNIASDLHDDLGSTLNSVKVFTNLAISGIKQEESLQAAKDNLTEATMGLRDMIWVLDDSLDTVDELVTRLRQYALPVGTAVNMKIVIKADPEVYDKRLGKDEKRNLFLICKEAINNSIKYSGANELKVDFTPAGKKIQIAISDNGHGFHEGQIQKGYGLKNMEYRAKQIKYSASINSSPENGTLVTLAPQ